MRNNDPNAQLKDQLHRQVALAALTIADRKRKILEKQQDPIIKTKEISQVNKFFEFIKKKVMDINTMLVGHKVDLYVTLEAQEALIDVMMIIIYLQN